MGEIQAEMRLNSVAVGPDCVRYTRPWFTILVLVLRLTCHRIWRGEPLIAAVLQGPALFAR